MPLKRWPAKQRQKNKKLSKILKILILISVCISIGICIFLCYKVNGLQEQIKIVYDKIGSKELAVWQEETEIKLAERAEQEELKDYLEVEKQEAEKADVDLKAEDNKNKAYLTFDDGPSAATAQILDILKEYDVKATFFVIGKTDENSVEMYKRIVAEGHTLAMHSYSHKYSEIYESVKAFAEDFNKLRDYLYEVTGVKPDIYRFPGGSSNTVSKIGMKEFIKYIDAKNVVYFDWNVSAGDASSKRMLSVDKIVENVMSDVKKHPSAVILMHDAKGKASTLEALPLIIEKLKEEEVEIRPIDRMVPPVQHIEVQKAWIEEPKDKKTEKKAVKNSVSGSEPVVPTEAAAPEAPVIPEIPVLEVPVDPGIDGAAVPGT